MPGITNIEMIKTVAQGLAISSSRIKTSIQLA